jgi:hypothetical protein
MEFAGPAVRKTPATVSHSRPSTQPKRVGFWVRVGCVGYSKVYYLFIVLFFTRDLRIFIFYAAIHASRIERPRRYMYKFYLIISWAIFCILKLDPTTYKISFKNKTYNFYAFIKSKHFICSKQLINLLRNENGEMVNQLYSLFKSYRKNIRL